MRRHNDMDLGFSPVVPRHMGNPVYAGLGAFGWADSAVGDSAKNKLATSYMSTATTDPALGSDGWKFLRSKWYDVLHFDDWEGDSDSNQKSRCQSVIDAINSDTVNPAFTDWDNTALGKFFGSTITDAKAKAGWNVYKPDANNTNFGNRLALLCYKKQKPELWPIISKYMSETPTRMFKEHLDVLGISNPYAKTVAFWEQNPKFDYKAAAGVTSQPQQQVTIQPPPFDFGKLNATDLALRDNPNKDAKKIRALNPPMYAKILGTSGTFVQVQLMDGTTGWTSSGSETKAYWTPATQDEAYGKAPSKPVETQIPAPQVIPQQIPTVPQVPVSTTIPMQQGGGSVGITVPAPQPQTPETPAAETPEAKKESNVGMYVGIGAGVLVAGGLAYFLLRKKD